MHLASQDGKPLWYKHQIGKFGKKSLPSLSPATHLQRVKASIHYASQHSATRLPRVVTPTLRLPPPIFCCGSPQAATFDDLQHVEVSDCTRSGAVLAALTKLVDRKTMLPSVTEVRVAKCAQRCTGMAPN